METDREVHAPGEFRADAEVPGWLLEVNGVVVTEGFGVAESGLPIRESA